jgi:predicted deacylase
MKKNCFNKTMKFDETIQKFLPHYVIVSGLHGDEPAGNLAAEYFKNYTNVKIFSYFNEDGTRRKDGKDLNRHFDTKDQSAAHKSLLKKIEMINPSLVISLHEDNESKGVYAYCSLEISKKIQDILLKCNIPLADKVFDDIAENGVIVNGKQPYQGTLERALKRRNIPYCTLETPSSQMSIEERVKILVFIVKSVLN